MFCARNITLRDQAMASLLHKDLTYALRLADEVKTPMPIVAAAREVYRLAGNQGLEAADFSAVIEALRHTASEPIENPQNR